MTITLHEHQREAITKMHNGCVLHGGVGTGKTITSLGYAMEKESDRKIVVVTTAKVRDSIAWEREAAKLLMDPDNIEVTSWNKINDLVKYEDKFFIFDEQRLVGSGAWVKAFYKIAKKNHWILLSATPGDSWADYGPMFIANGWYKNITEFRREHAVYSRYTNFPKVERWVNEGRLQKYRKQLLVKMPMDRHTTKHMHYIECDYDKDTLDVVRKRRWNVYEDKPLKNAAELYGVMRKVVSSDPDRRAKMRDLILTHPRLIVFYNFNYELEALREICQELALAKFESGINKTGMSEHSMSIEQWETGSSGLMVPRTNSTSSDISSPTIDLPWDLTPEEKASGQKVTTRKITSREDITRWTESKESTTSRATRSRTGDKLYETTVKLDEQQLSPSQISGAALLTTESPKPENSPEPRTKSGHDAEQLEKTATSSGKRTSRTAQSTVSTTAESWPGLKENGSLTAETPSSSGLISKLDTSTQKDQTFDWAEWNGHKHQPIPDTDNWVYLVQYASGSEGWNCVETDAMAFWSLTYSWKQYNQAQGRIDRLNTPYTDLHYYVLMTDSVAEKPVIKSLEQKKDFQPR